MLDPVYGERPATGRFDPPAGGSAALRALAGSRGLTRSGSRAGGCRTGVLSTDS